MHELAVTENLLNLALQHAAKHHAARVTGLNLVIGELSGFVNDSIQFYWDHVSRDTLCEGAQLNFRRVPATFACLNCQTRYTLDGEMMHRPDCSGSRIRMVAGDEFHLESIVIEIGAEGSVPKEGKKSPRGLSD